MTAPPRDTEFRRTHAGLEPRFVRPGIELRECPVETSLGVLGRKWTLLILRDIGSYGRDRFNLLEKSLPCIAPKVLATRLKELEAEGYLRRTIEKSRPPRIVRWSLTGKGLDAIRIGMLIAAFGAKWHADRVFHDQRPRSLGQLYDRDGMEFLRKAL